PPAVSLIGPTNGSTYTGDASVTVTAGAAADFNLLEKIDVYRNGMLFATASNITKSDKTFSFTATGLEEGHYALKAVARDVTGLATTPARENITVSPGSGQDYGMTRRTRASAFLRMPKGLAGILPPQLSLTGVFTNTPDMDAAAALIPYSVNVPLWD